MKRFANIALYCSAFLIAAHFAAAGNPAPEFEKKFWTILEGEKAALKLDNAETKLEWSSDNPSVAKVNAKGEVTGIGYGIANITASGKGVKVSVPVYVLVKGFGELGRPLDEEMIFSHQVKLIRNAVMQCFDIDSNGEIYYIQVGGLLSAGYGKPGISRRVRCKRKPKQDGQSNAHDPTTGNHEVAGRSGKARKRLGTSSSGLLPSCFLISALLRLFVFSPFAGDSGFLGFTHSR